MASVLGWIVGSTAGGSWENYYIVGEHMHVTKMFLNNFIKTEKFLTNLCHLDDKSGFLDTEQLGVYCINMYKTCLVVKNKEINVKLCTVFCGF
jgi:hypothetical protein